LGPDVSTWKCVRNVDRLGYQKYQSTPAVIHIISGNLVIALGQ
jgi:hypothetical protein